MTTTTVSPAVTRMRPTGPQTAHAVDLLENVPLSGYWPNLAWVLVEAVEHIHDVHAKHCSEPRCPTCAAVRQAMSTVDAHDAVQDGGCGCPGCATVPYPTRQFRQAGQ
jgi:hypothetical protein